MNVRASLNALTNAQRWERESEDMNRNGLKVVCGHGVLRRWAAVGCAGALLAGVALAQPAPAAAQKTRDIVLDTVMAPALSPVVVVPGGAVAPVRSDAMLVSVLVESADGTLTPRSTEQMFRTGERFRVRLLAAREARVSFYNTNPQGVFNPQPVWQGSVTPGQETISPRLRLEGNTGVDQLHVVLEPEAPPQGVIAWLQGLLRGSRSAPGQGSRDIRLDVENTPQATYLLNTEGQGLMTTVRIVHR